MANLREKELSARKRFEGKLVRPIFSTNKFKRCVRVRAHGQPSGWTVHYQIFTSKHQYFNALRMTDVEIKED